MKKNKILLFLILILSLIMTACGQKNADNTKKVESVGNKGTLIVSVNPEVKVEYDSKGNVTAIKANNSDANAILKELSGLEGKPVKEVVKSIVEKIGEKGYLKPEIDKANSKEIVLELEKGSFVPNEEFINNVVAEIQAYIDSGKWTDDKDDDKSLQPKLTTKNFSNNNVSKISNNSETSNSSNKNVNLEEARQIALKDAGLNASQVKFTKAEKDNDDGVVSYEFEFYSDSHDYEYDIRESDGKIISREIEKLSNSNKRTIRTSNNSNKASSNKNLTLEEARQIALRDAGLNASQVKFTKAEKDNDDGVISYEFEFHSNSHDYEYDISIDGKILSREIERISSSNQSSTPSTSNTNNSYSPTVTNISSDDDDDIDDYDDDNDNDDDDDRDDD